MKKNLAASALIILGMISGIFGQNEGNQTGADRTLRGSGRVNASTLGMEFELPLGSYNGRGINVPINLSYSSKVWRMQYVGQTPIPGGNSSPCYSQYVPEFGEESASGWTSSLAVPYIEYVGADNRFEFTGAGASTSDIDCPSTTGGGENSLQYYIRRLLVHLPGGETHELRADDTAIGFVPNGQSDPNGPYQPYKWDATFYGADSSNIKYIQDSSTGTYRLLMPDGSRYDFDATTPHGSDRKAVRFTDRNGNFTTYYGPGSVDGNGVTHPNGYWKDTLGRNISIPLGLEAPAVPTPAGSPQVYSIPGMTGTYKLNWKNLKGATPAESGLTTFSDQLKYPGDRYAGESGACGNSYPTFCYHPAGTFLFTGDGNAIIASSGVFNPIVLTGIELPTGQKYKFSYDVYGRIEHISYPTGGEEKLVYNVVPTLSMLEPGDTGAQTNFGVTNRKVYKFAGDPAPYEWNYSANYVAPYGYQVNINNPDGTRVERFLRRGNDAGMTFGTFGYDNALAGMAFEEKGYDNSNPRKLVSKKLTTWGVTPMQLNISTTTAHWHPRVIAEESVIYDTAGNGVSGSASFEYEDEANLTREKPVLQKKSSQYAFVVAGNAPPAVPVRTSESVFLINNNSVPQAVRDAYKARNMVGMVTASEIKDGAGTIVSRSEMKYDEAIYPIIYAGSAVNWQDPNNIYRGNPTTSRVWDSTKGAAADSGAYIAIHAQFDNFGNQRKTWDAMGNMTETEFSATYSYSLPTKVTSAVPDPNPSQNHDGLPHGSQTAFVTTATFDPVTGLPLTATDANGLETRIEYDPITLRPLNSKTYYQNSQVGSRSETIYHDEPGNYWVKNRSQIDETKWAETTTYFDGLGRAYRAEQVDSGGNIFVDKEFDAEGRVLRVSNPYRANETKIWTTNVYDEASRIKQVVLPDGSTVKTDYGVSISGVIGATKQITDQAGKKRKGISNALGRMVRVVEDPAGQNLSTDYVFDTMGNLRKTIQGEQSRYFSHDSLGRLLRAKQPEQEVNTALAMATPDAITGHNQWSVGYEYDNNGNITKTTDARGVFIEADYDNFNRLTFRDYSDSTPDVDFYYDGYYLDGDDQLQTATGSVKGKTTGVKSPVSKTNLTGFDDLGRLSTHQQITDGNTYATEYSYNLSGALIEETYPSGRKVKHTLDQNGELSLVQSRKNANQGYVDYASSFKYNSSGAVEKMRLGNGHWETTLYNNRQQVTQIGLGTTDADQNLLKLEYGYGDSTQNNGSLRSQKISFNGLSQAFEQTYTYDDLNRIQLAEEKVGGTPNWKQGFQYDRFGNRRFDAANTTTLLQSNNITNPTIDTATNRFSSGQNYLYDKTGNLTQDAEGRQFIYDAENHQKEVKDANGTTVGLYLYDGGGLRVKKISSTETTIFVYNASATLVAEYSTQVAPTQQVSYLTQDHLGSPRVITDQDGSVTTRTDYMAFGDEANRTVGLGYDNPSETRKGYTGYEKDGESGLDFAQARYYNSTHGRFTSVDPLTASATIRNPQTFNRYSYVLNSPYKFTDPLGLLPRSTSKPNNCNYKRCVINGERYHLDELFQDQVATNEGVANESSGDSNKQIQYHAYYIQRNGTIVKTPIRSTNGNEYHVQNEGNSGYTLVATLKANRYGLVKFPDSSGSFGRYGDPDPGGENNGVKHGVGDHYIKPEVAAALFGLTSVLMDKYDIKISFGDMSAENGTDPYTPGGKDHVWHGHTDRSGLDIDFRYINKNGVSFQGEMTNSQFDTQKNQAVYDTAKMFGFTENFQGTANKLNGIKTALGHNDHGHLGFNFNSANIVAR